MSFFVSIDQRKIDLLIFFYRVFIYKTALINKFTDHFSK